VVNCSTRNRLLGIRVAVLKRIRAYDAHISITAIVSLAVWGGHPEDVFGLGFVLGFYDAQNYECLRLSRTSTASMASRASVERSSPILRSRCRLAPPWRVLDCTAE
jgi:hypothetical protein